MGKRTLTIGNLFYSVSCSNDMSLYGLDSFYRDKTCDPKRADCTMEIVHDDIRNSTVSAYKNNRRLFEADRTWGLYRGGKAGGKCETIMTVPALKRGGRSKVFAEFDSSFKSGTVYTSRAETHYFFYPFLEVLTINLLAEGRGVLLHACCIDDNGTGYLFLGESGAGKSTLANLWNERKGITVLSDDRVLASVTEQGLTAYGTPWHGTEKYAVNAHVPVKKIFFISHADKNSAVPLSGVTAASELVRNAFLPFWDKQRMEYSMEFLIEVSKRAQLFRLGVYPDRKIIDLVRNI